MTPVPEWKIGDKWFRILNKHLTVTNYRVYASTSCLWPWALLCAWHTHMRVRMQSREHPVEMVSLLSAGVRIRRNPGTVPLRRLFSPFFVSKARFQPNIATIYSSYLPPLKTFLFLKRNVPLSKQR